LDQRRDIDQDELMQTRCGNGSGISARGGGSWNGCVLVAQRGLAPGGISLVDIEASGSGDSVDIEAECGLGDGRVGRQSSQIEADVGVGAFLHREKRGRAVDLGLVGAIGEAVVGGWGLGKAGLGDGEKKRGQQCKPQSGRPT
jgi:hypothetical protein